MRTSVSPVQSGGGGNAGFGGARHDLDVLAFPLPTYLQFEARVGPRGLLALALQQRRDNPSLRETVRDRAQKVPVQ